jgi:hypothetical protein
LPWLAIHKCIVRASKRLTEYLRAASERRAPRPRLSCHAGAGKRHVRDTAAQLETSNRSTAGVVPSAAAAGRDGVRRCCGGCGSSGRVRWCGGADVVLLRPRVATADRRRIRATHVLSPSDRGRSERQPARFPVLLSRGGAAREMDGPRGAPGLRHRHDAADRPRRVALRPCGAVDRAHDRSGRISPAATGARARTDPSHFSDTTRRSRRSAARAEPECDGSFGCPRAVRVAARTPGLRAAAGGSAPRRTSDRGFPGPAIPVSALASDNRTGHGSSVHSGLTIRPARPGDESVLFEMIRELAVFEKLEHLVTAVPSALRCSSHPTRRF